MSEDEKPISFKDMVSKMRAAQARRGPDDPEVDAKIREVMGRAEAENHDLAPAADCRSCRHHRPNGRPSTGVLVAALGDQTMRALSELGQQEGSAMSQEMRERRQAMETQDRDATWSARPLVSEYCGLGETGFGRRTYGIAELKNRGGRCGDFEPGHSGGPCSACRWRRDAKGPELKRDHDWALIAVTDPLGHKSAGDGPFVPTERYKHMEEERRRNDAEAAMELTQATFSGGYSAMPPHWFDYCDNVAEPGRGVAFCAFLNADDRCPSFEPEFGKAHLFAEPSREPPAPPPREEPKADPPEAGLSRIMRRALDRRDDD